MAKIEVSPEINKSLKQYAEERGCTTDEAAEHVLTVGINRLSALRRYGKKLGEGKKPAAKKTAKKATKKAAKAKGPIARKAKGAKKAPAAEAPAAEAAAS